MWSLDVDRDVFVFLDKDNKLKVPSHCNFTYSNSVGHKRTTWDVTNPGRDHPWCLHHFIYTLSRKGASVLLLVPLKDCKLQGC